MKRSVFALAVIGLMLALMMPVTAFGQGRGRGRGHGRGFDRSWKCSKFVNCHDARDGRIDGRGPGGRRIRRGIFDDDDIFLGNRRSRRINRDNDFFRRNRNRRVDRDGDGDVDRFDFLLGRRQNRLERREARRHLRGY